MIIVVYGSGVGAKGGEKTEIFKDVSEVKDVFGAFIGGVNFRFGGAACCDSLTFGYPMERAVEPL